MKRNFPVWLGIGLVVIAAYLIYILLNQPFNVQQPGGGPKTNPQQSSGQSNQPPIEKTELQVAPDFTLTDLEGNSVTLSDYAGKKNIYLNFWASWCSPCRLEMPDLEEIYQAYQDQDLVVLAVNVGESREEVQDFINRNGYNFKVLLDTKNKAASLYKASSIPTSVFINKEGLIVGKRVGLMTAAEMEAYISQLFK